MILLDIGTGRHSWNEIFLSYNGFVLIFYRQCVRGGSREKTVLATERVIDSHLHPLDRSYVSSVTHKVLHGAGCEAFLSLRQVQPQPVGLNVVGPDDNDKDPGRGAAITIHPSGQGEMIGDDWSEK